MARKRIAVLIAPWMAALLASGVALAQSQPPAQQQPPSTPQSAPSQAPKVTPGEVDPETTTGAAVDPKSYIIGPPDILYVKVFRDKDFTGSYEVRPDGKITLPLIGDMQAEGLTPERLGAQIKQALSDLIINPDVNVMILQVNSKKYTVAGEVNRPGAYPLVAKVTVFDALNIAGGFRDFANEKNITIIRGTKRLKFNYKDFIKGKKVGDNVLLENGDTVLVP